jgi:hypothetical protein
MRFLNWLKNIFNQIISSIWKTLTDLLNNFEAVIILTFSTIGLTTVLAEIPFHYALPAFIDVPLVIPVLSVLTILSLITIMSWRLKYVI